MIANVGSHTRKQSAFGRWIRLGCSARRSDGQERFGGLHQAMSLPVLLMMLLQVHITRPWEVQGELGRQLEEWCPQLLP